MGSLRSGAGRWRCLAVIMAVVVAMSSAAGASAADPALPPLPSPQVPDPANLTAADAVAHARKTGRAVEATGAASATDTLVAHPDGRLRLTRHAVPVRAKAGGVWKALDATLKRNADGTLSPTLAASGLAFSGGGHGPLATMRQSGKALALSVPVNLPAPVLSGASATYAAVLPGVDLTVTATTLGGFSHVLTVHDAAAAANPALDSLLSLTAAGQGLTVSADAAGNLKAGDPSGRVYFAAPTPLMWDSSRPQGQAPAANRSDTATTAPNASVSNVDGPSASATVKPVPVTVSGSTITLEPDQGLLAGENTMYPVFIDPSWAVVPTLSGRRVGYASVAKAFPSSNYWNNTADPNKDNLQFGWNDDPWHARTMVNFEIDVATLKGATISDATIKARSVYSGSCTPTKARVFAPATTLTSGNATWNFWNNPAMWEAEIGSATYTGGYSSSCPASDITFHVLAGVTKAVNADRSTQTFVFTGDSNETSDTGSYKELSLASIAMEITYNHTPNQPTGLSTSPATNCPHTQTTTVGDAPVTLYAPVSDRNGGILGVHYEVWKGPVGTPPATPWKSTNPDTFTATSPSTAVYTLSQADLRTAANGTVTEFTWRVRAYDGIATSAWSTECKFKFDPTRPGAPTAAIPAGDKFIGTPFNITITKPATGSQPSKYLYQLNTSPAVYTPADASGNATIAITPTRRTNSVTITAISAGGNPGLDSAVVTFTTTPTTQPPAPGDLTGDGTADLVLPGGNQLPTGVWLAAGKGNGQTEPRPVNIGINGNGRDTTPSPASFTGTQILTGRFYSSGVQDILAYYPPGTGAVQGSAVIVKGNGDGSPLTAHLDGNQLDLPATFLQDQDQDQQPVPDSWPLQLANAGNSYVEVPPSGTPDVTDDLIGISGTPAGGYHLSYYWCPSEGSIQPAENLTVTTPDGDMAWQNWKVATATIAATGKTHLFLWRPSSGKLVLWKDITFTVDMNTGDKTFSYTSYNLATGWNTSAALTLHAADTNGDTLPDLWTSAGAVVKTYKLSTIQNGYAIETTASTTQTLNTASHNWFLTDKPESAANGSPVTTALADTTTGTALPLTASSGVTWHTSDPTFNPSITFNGTSGSLAGANPVDITNDFTLTAWAKPASTSGTLLSVNGNATALMRLYADGSDNSWRFGLARTDTATPIWDTANAGANTVNLGVWTQLTITYKKSTGVMRLYLDSSEKGAATHLTGVNPTGASAYKAGRSHSGSYFTGQLSATQAWAGTTLIPGPNPTEGSNYRNITPTRFLDTRTGSPIASGGDISVKITGVNGIPASTTGKKVTAVAVNLTTITPGAIGYLTAYPDQTPRPNLSTMNFNPGQVNSGYTIVPVGDNGYLRLYAGTASPVHVIADVSGYFTTDTTGAPATYKPVNPYRFGNTVTGIGGHSGAQTSGTTRTYTIGGTSGIPSGITAVAVNITAVSASALGYVNTWQQGQTQPSTSGLQYQAGEAFAQMTIVAVNPANGQFNLFTSQTSHFLIDVMGYFTPGTNEQKYYPHAPTRVIDTRTGSPVPGGTAINITAAGTVPGRNTTLVLGQIVCYPTGNGFAATYPSDITLPPISNINYVSGQPAASNTALANTGSNATVSFYTNVQAHLITDITGYFTNN